ncbi:MAG: hypothetical protein LBC67_00785, partial [Spirochaetales bacterium]|nr:hypothetical protein [Spirochaetales bacterium]
MIGRKILAGLIACAALISGCSKTQTSQGTARSGEGGFENEEAAGRTIYVSYGGGLCTSPMALAAYFGFYKNEGLNVEIVKVESEKEALVTGKIDAAGGFMA